MAKGALIKFRSYQETVPKILELIGLASEIKKYDKIVLKPGLFAEFNNSNPKTINPNDRLEDKKSTNSYFVEQVLKFIVANKNPVAEVFIAEGLDGGDTLEAFDKLGYKSLAEKYDIGLIDLNNAEVQEVTHQNFRKFSTIMYPRVLLESFVISLPKLSESQESDIFASLPNMLG